MNRPLIFITILSCLHLGACAQLQKSTGAESTSASVRTIEAPHLAEAGWLEYTATFSELSADAQKKELVQISQALLQNKGDMNNRMKAAIIYALPNSRMRDTAKAQILLDDLLREKTLDNERKNLATLLRDHLNESSKLTQKARDEQKRADSLQQKLDDLKNIEKTMSDRDQGIRK